MLTRVKCETLSVNFCGAFATKPRSEMAGEQKADSELHELLRGKEAECAQLRADVTKLRKALEESKRLQASQAQRIEELQEQLDE